VVCLPPCPQMRGYGFHRYNHDAAKEFFSALSRCILKPNHLWVAVRPIYRE
jgi:hypothetical protein